MLFSSHLDNSPSSSFFNSHGFLIINLFNPFLCFFILFLMLFSLWVSLSSLFLPLFTFLFRVFYGVKNFETSVDGFRPTEEEAHDGGGGGADEVMDEKGNNGFVFNFRFQTYDEFIELNKESFDCERLSNRYEFSPEKISSYFVEEAEISSFTVGVLNSSSNCEVLNFETDDEKITELSEDGTEEFSVLEKQRKLKQSDGEENEFVEEIDIDIGYDYDTNVDGDRSDFEIDIDVDGCEPEDEKKEGWGEDWEELNGLETEWEHQELVEQLKMELKKVRETGLPTIYEESESPKIMGELKPWKIDERFKNGDLMEEIHKFYTTYRERMRKLDILNYQKMYAMGVLQSKGSLKSFASNSNSNSKSSSITSLVRLYRQKKCQVDPMKDFIREVHCDLELVYVGQMCLSWDFIQWQYQKALALWDSQPHDLLHHYNELATDFQQFQVLLQRFLENEAFDGPRVENYAKHRCVARNLLQVPVIREDKRKDRRKARLWRDHENEASTNDMLIEILQESIRVIWKFIRTDKDQRLKKFEVELQDPGDKQLLIEIQADLRKKEKKLKEIVRSGHCILKKLKRNYEEGDEEKEGCLSFFCEVDMKLVGRVLKMSRITTDQLVWCRNKLNRINFFNRKIHVESSFFLFPC